MNNNNNNNNNNNKCTYTIITSFKSQWIQPSTVALLIEET